MKRVLSVFKPLAPMPAPQAQAGAADALPAEAVIHILERLPERDYLSQHGLARTNRHMHATLEPVLRTRLLLMRDLHEQVWKDEMGEDPYYFFRPRKTIPHSHEQQCMAYLDKRLQALKKGVPAAYRLQIRTNLVEEFCAYSTKLDGMAKAYLQALLDEVGSIRLQARPGLAETKYRCLKSLAAELQRAPLQEAWAWEAGIALVRACADLPADDRQFIYGKAQTEDECAGTEALRRALLFALFQEGAADRRASCMDQLELIRQSEDPARKLAALAEFERLLPFVLQGDDRAVMAQAVHDLASACCADIIESACTAGKKEWDDTWHALPWDWLIRQQPENERLAAWMKLLSASSRSARSHAIVFLRCAIEGLSALSSQTERGLFAEALCEALFSRPEEMAMSGNFDAGMRLIADALPAGRYAERCALLLADLGKMGSQAYESRLQAIGVLACMLPGLSIPDERRILGRRLMDEAGAIFSHAEEEESNGYEELFGAVFQRILDGSRHLPGEELDAEGRRQLRKSIEDFHARCGLGEQVVMGIAKSLESMEHEGQRQAHMDFLVDWIREAYSFDELSSFLEQAKQTLRDGGHRARICLALAARLHDETSFGDRDDAILLDGLADLLPEHGAGIAEIVPKLLMLVKRESRKTIAGMHPPQTELHQALVAKLAGYLPLLPPAEQEAAFFWLFDNFAAVAFEHGDAGILFIQRLARSLLQLHDSALRDRTAYRMMLYASELEAPSRARLLAWMAEGLAAQHDATEQRQKMLLLASAAASLDAIPRQRILFSFAGMLLRHEDEVAQAFWLALNSVLAGGDIASPDGIEDIGE